MLSFSSFSFFLKKVWVTNAVVTVFLAVCSAAVAEGITWLIIRTDRYIKLNREIEKQSKRVVQMKINENRHMEDDLEVQLAEEEDQLKKNINVEISIQALSALVSWTAVMVLLFISNILCNGKVAARMPSLPSWIRGLNYRNLPGNGYYDFAYVILYLLCLLWFRCKIQNCLGSIAAAVARRFREAPPTTPKSTTKFTRRVRRIIP